VFWSNSNLPSWSVNTARSFNRTRVRATGRPVTAVDHHTRNLCSESSKWPRLRMTVAMSKPPERCRPGPQPEGHPAQRTQASGMQRERAVSEAGMHPACDTNRTPSKYSEVRRLHSYISEARTFRDRSSRSSTSDNTYLCILRLWNEPQARQSPLPTSATNPRDKIAQALNANRSSGLWRLSPLRACTRTRAAWPSFRNLLHLPLGDASKRERASPQQSTDLPLATYAGAPAPAPRLPQPVALRPLGLRRRLGF